MIVRYVNLGGERRPISFGTAALAKFCKRIKRNYQRLDFSNLNLDEYLILIHECLRDGARKDNQPFTAKVDEIGDWLDADPKGIEAVMTEFWESMGGEEGAKKPKGEEKAA